MPYIINREKLAWAGGFFDGEGSTTFKCKNRPNKDGRKYRYPKITISQSGNSELLEKFKSIISIGKIYGAYCKHSTAKLPRFVYDVRGFKEVQFVMGILWNFIGTQKRNQARRVLKYYLNHMRRKK